MEDGPPRFPRGFTCPAVLRYRPRGFQVQIRGFHPLWRSFPARFSCLLSDRLWPALQPRTDKSARFGLFPVRSPLLRDSRLISFPPGTEMFHFPGSACYGLCIQPYMTGHDSRRVSPFRNPRIKGCLAPPRGLSQLTASFIAFRRQGIHLLLLVTCFINPISMHPANAECTTRKIFPSSSLFNCQRTNHVPFTENIGSAFAPDASISATIHSSQAPAWTAFAEKTPRLPVNQVLVEADGLEPTTSGLQSRRSPN